MALALFALGLVLLIVGAEALVRGASKLASIAGISPLVVGLTVVAFGTSAPELAVSARSVTLTEGGADIALGNVVGSNIFNVLFILGLSAIIAPLRVSYQLVRLDAPIMVGVSLLVLALAWNGTIGRFDGAFLFIGILIYTVFTIYQGRKETRVNSAAVETKPSSASQIGLNILFVIIGLAMLIVGSRWLINGAVALAKHLGVSDLIIALTVVAAGTSLPEVATSVLASIRGERDIAVGNVVGSNIFNILAVLGLSALFAPKGINVAQAAFHFDIPVMIAVAVMCLPIFFTGYQISRWEGLLFLGYYIAYTTYVVLAATQHDALSVWSGAMFIVVIPLTVLILAIAVIRQMRMRGRIL